MVSFLQPNTHSLQLTSHNTELTVLNIPYCNLKALVISKTHEHGSLLCITATHRHNPKEIPQSDIITDSAIYQHVHQWHTAMTPALPVFGGPQLTITYLKTVCLHS